MGSNLSSTCPYSTADSLEIPMSFDDSNHQKRIIHKKCYQPSYKVYDFEFDVKKYVPKLQGLEKSQIFLRRLHKKRRASNCTTACEESHSLYLKSPPTVLNLA